MTPEEIARMHEQNRKEREKRDAVKVKSASKLTQEQRDTILMVYKTISGADSSLREMRDVTMEDARAIDIAEYRMRSAFPDLCMLEECTC